MNSYLKYRNTVTTMAKLFMLGSLLFLSLTIFSCKEDPPVSCKSVLEAPKEYLDYWYFQEGSWWVYQLEGSNPAIYDTVIVIYNKAEYPDPYDNSWGLYRTCLMHYQITLQHSNKIYFPSFTGTGNGGSEVLLSQQDTPTNAWYIQWASQTDHASPNIAFI